MKKPTLYIVIPCYNEESVLPITGPLFSDKLSELEEEELIDIDEVRANIASIEEELREVQAQMEVYLRELGL